MLNKQRREEETIYKEKLNYWHLIKKDVVNYKREVAKANALARKEQ